MPFKSDTQQRYLFAKEPAVAAKFAAMTPKGAKLPERVDQTDNPPHPDKKAKGGKGGTSRYSAHWKGKK